MQVTLVDPSAKIEPDCGRQLTDGDVSTASVAAGVVNVTTAPLALVASALTPASDGSAGAVESTTDTMNELNVEFPLKSSA